MITEQDIIDAVSTRGKYYREHTEPYMIEWNGHAVFAISPRKLVLKICKMENIEV